MSKEQAVLRLLIFMAIAAAIFWLVGAPPFGWDDAIMAFGIAISAWIGWIIGERNKVKKVSNG